MLAPYNVIPELVILMYNVLLYAHINAFFIPISQYLGVLSFFCFLSFPQMSGHSEKYCMTSLDFKVVVCP